MAKKLISLLLALVLCVGVLAACGPKNEGPAIETLPNVDPNTGEYMTPNLNGAKVKVYLATIKTHNIDEAYAKGVVEKALNMDLEYVQLDNFGEGFPAMLAEGQKADITYQGGTWSTTWEIYGQNGAFINVLDYLDYMPNLKKFLEAHWNDGLLDKYLSEDGTTMYAIPIATNAATNAWTYLYRDDVFAANNLTWPKNQTEFEATLRKLKEQYPNSWPFAMTNLTNKMQGLQQWGNQWGGTTYGYSAYNSFFTQDANGNNYFGQTSDAYKEAAQWIKKMTDEGLMHPSSMTMSRAQWKEAFANNDCFVTFDKIDQISGLVADAQTLNPDFSIAVGAPFNMGTYAETTDVVYVSTANTGAAGAFTIGNGNNIANSMAYIDWLYSEEGMVATSWGVEGESYEVDADGNKKFIDSFLANYPVSVKNSGLGDIYNCGSIDGYAYLSTIDENIREGLEIVQPFRGKGPRQYTLKFNESEQFIWDIYGKAMNSYAWGEYAKFCLGQRDFSEWEAFKQELKNGYSYDILLSIHNSALARMKNK